MAIRKVLAAVATVGLLAPPAAQAQDKAAYRLAGQWAVDFGDDYCRLAGNFSNGNDELALAMERIQPGPMLRLMLASDGIKPFRGASNLGYQFLSAGGGQEVPYFRTETPDGQEYIFLDNLTLAPFAFTPPVPGTPPAPPPPYDRTAEQETARGITAVVVEKGLTDPVRIETGSLKAPVTVLQDCADDLLKVWGLDVDKHKTMTVPVVPNFSPDGWLPSGMIPFSEFGKFVGNGNQVRLIVDASGKPTSCAIHTPRLDQSLNERICSTLMEKATFQPAKDVNGQPMASYWFGSPMFLGPPIGGRR